MNKAADNIIGMELEKDERLVWSGRPYEHLTLRFPEDLFLVPISIIWVVVATVWDINIFMEARSMPTPAVLIHAVSGALFFIAGLYLLVGRILIDANIRLDSRYCLTNSRILINTGFKPERTGIINIDELEKITVRKSEKSGRGTIIFGPGKKFLKSLVEKIFPMIGRNQVHKFDMIDDVDKVYNAIKKQM